MDTQSAAPEKTAIDVRPMIEAIKRDMPSVYDMIQCKAKEIGNEAFAHVRAGLRGEVNRFYAFERGRVVGTPFACPEISDTVAGYMVKFGVSACAIWAVQAPAQAEGQSHGAH
jgi:hypothetical protein